MNTLLNPRLKPSRLLFFSAIFLLLISGLVYLSALFFFQLQAGKSIASIISSVAESPNHIFTCQSLSPGDSEVRNELSGAIEYLIISRRLNPLNSYTYFLLGRAYCLAGDPAKAVSAYRNYLMHHPENPLGRFELGMAYEHQGQLDLATQEWRKAGYSAQEMLSASGLGEADYPFGYGQTEYLDHYRNGLAWIERALALDPQDQSSRIQAARLCQVFFIEDLPLCNQVLSDQAGNWLIDPVFENTNTWFTWENSLDTKYDIIPCPDLPEQRCAHIQITGDVPAGGAGFYQCLRPESGKKYQFSSWIKTDVAEDALWCPLCFESRTDMQQVDGPDDWRLWEYTFTASDSTSEVNCFFPAILQSQGQLWIRNPSLLQVPPS